MFHALSPQILLEAMEGIVYVVDRRGIIVAAGNNNWNAFAAENGAPDLRGESVIGCSLFDSISGAEVRDSYQRFMQSILSGTHDTLSFTMRCDAPEIHRVIRLSLSPIRNGENISALLFQHLLISETDRPRINLFEPERIASLAEIPAGATVVTICSYCHDVRLPPSVGLREQRWVPPEQYYASGGDPDVMVSHGICHVCHDRLIAPLIRDGQDCVSPARISSNVC